MNDPTVEIRDLLTRYERAHSARSVEEIAELHLRDERFLHTWTPGRGDEGWQSYEKRLTREFETLPPIRFRVIDPLIRVFEGAFAVASAEWECWMGEGGGSRRTGGRVTFVLAKTRGSWRIVADHFSVI